MTAIQQTNPQSQQEVLYAAIEAAASGANGTAAAETDGSSPPPYLTPQSLMAYCQSRLQNIGTQIQTAMTQQQNADWEQSGVGKILTEISNDSAGTTNGVMNNPGECQTLETNIETLITQIQQRDPGCSQLSQLEQLHDSIMATGSGPFTDSSNTYHGYYGSSTASVGQSPNGPTPPSSGQVDQDNTISTSEFGDFTSTLNNINSSLNSGATMGIITIQSLVSEQTTAIQLATSTLQALSDGTEKIVDKIGT